MSLSEKYNIPKETVVKMVNDGVISCSWPSYEHIYYVYKKHKGVDKESAARKTAEEANVDIRQVYRVIHRFE